MKVLGNSELNEHYQLIGLHSEELAFKPRYISIAYPFYIFRSTQRKSVWSFVVGPNFQRMLVKTLKRPRLPLGDPARATSVSERKRQKWTSLNKGNDCIGVRHALRER